MAKQFPLIEDVIDPQPGDLARDYYSNTKVWHLCCVCGEGRWVQRSVKSLPKMCRACRSKNRAITASGYRPAYVSPDDPLFIMSYRGQVMEHRLIMARHVGRPLKRDEVVHHINGDKLDNRIENLQLMSHSEHRRLHDIETRRMHELEARIESLEGRVVELERENSRLKEIVDAK